MESFNVFLNEAAQLEPFLDSPSRESFAKFAETLPEVHKQALLGLLKGEQPHKAKRNTDDPGWLAWWFDIELGAQITSQRLPQGTKELTRSPEYEKYQLVLYNRAVRDRESLMRRQQASNWNNPDWQPDESEEPALPYDPEDDAQELGQLSQANGALVVNLRGRTLAYTQGQWFSFEMTQDQDYPGLLQAWKEERPGNDNTLIAIAVHVARKAGILTVPRATVQAWKGRFH